MVGALIPIVVVMGVTFVFSIETPKHALPLQTCWQLPSFSDWGWLLLLASICTAYPFVATIKLLRSLTAFNVALAVNFEPIYSIILAYFIFGESERMTPVFYIGLYVVFGVVFLYPVGKRKIKV